MGCDIHSVAIDANEIRLNRIARETAAKAIAATLPAGDYFASGPYCEDRLTGYAVKCDSHWDACLVMLAAKRS